MNPRRRSVAIASSVLGSLAAGYVCGAAAERRRSSQVLPNGLPRTCSGDTPLPAMRDSSKVLCDPGKLFTDDQLALPERLKSIVGPDNVFTGGNSMKPFTIGARLGKGDALAVCQPGSLSEAVEVLRACASADVAILPQGRNTGLTGGSVPRSDKCDRPTVIINMCRVNKIHPIVGADQVLCLAGVGIYDLSIEASSMGKESHSVLGSIFLNPTVAAGVAFGSGGTQVRKGPAFTERALWCRISASGNVEVVNTLGLSCAENESELLDRVEKGGFVSADFTTDRPASAAEMYREHICNLDSQVSRFNGDCSGADPNRSEGKVLILATVHDLFPAPKEKKSLWISCDSFKDAQDLKRDVLLSNAGDLPISCEYMDRDSFDVIDEAGRALCLALEKIGLGSGLSRMWALKLSVESLPIPFFDTLPDRLLYYINNIISPTLPPEVYQLGKRSDHHLLVTVGEFGNGNLSRTMAAIERFQKGRAGMQVRVLQGEEVGKVTNFRFAAAPAFRTWCVGRGAQGISIDYALAKKDQSIPDFESFSGPNAPLKRMRYAHFACNVIHEDIAFREGVDVLSLKMDVKTAVEARGGRLPAEHGHGTEYSAPEESQLRWREMDPHNVMNPGVGGLPYGRDYK